LVLRLTSYRYNTNILVTFLDLGFIGSVGFEGHLTNSSLASNFLLQPDLVRITLPANTNEL